MANDNVLAAITVLLSDFASTLELTGDGVLEVLVPRHGYQAAQAIAALHHVESFLVALDAATVVLERAVQARNTAHASRTS